MKRLFKFKYPKLLALVLLSTLAYFIFSHPSVRVFFDSLESFSYFSVFIAGLLFSFGFTTPFAVAFFVTFRPDNILLATFVGGAGALLADMTIFKLIKFSFMDEFRRLERTKPMKEIAHLISHSYIHRAKNYVLYFFAGVVIASPLPDELGVSMLAGLTSIRTWSLALVSFTMNCVGIFIMLLIATA